jgi:hypothetical protein
MLEVSVVDPLGRDLPHRFAIDLPRAGLPDGATAPRFTSGLSRHSRWLTA